MCLAMGFSVPAWCLYLLCLTPAKVWLGEHPSPPRCYSTEHRASQLVAAGYIHWLNPLSISSPDSSISGMFYGAPANPAQQITTGISARCSCSTAGFAKHAQRLMEGQEGLMLKSCFRKGRGRGQHVDETWACRGGKGKELGQLFLKLNDLGSQG